MTDEEKKQQEAEEKPNNKQEPTAFFMHANDYRMRLKVTKDGGNKQEPTAFFMHANDYTMRLKVTKDGGLKALVSYTRNDVPELLFEIEYPRVVVKWLIAEWKQMIKP